jgi:hypothetical protein
MTDQEATLQDVWRLLGSLDQRLANVDQRLESVDQRLDRQEASLQDGWRLVGAVNRRVGELDRRVGERFDVVERELVAVNARVSAVEAGIAVKIGAFKEAIEARDFRLDEHGRRINKIEESLP